MAEKVKGSGNYRKLRVDPGDNAKYLTNSLKMWNWEKPDMHDPAAVERRVEDYFRLCIQDDLKPSVEGLAMAFGVHRKTIWCWSNDIDCHTYPQESLEAIKKAYRVLNVQLADYMQNGKIHPLAGMFLMQNNMDYEDRRKISVAPTPNVLGEELPPEQLREKYLKAIEVEGKALPSGAEDAERPEGE